MAADNGRTLDKMKFSVITVCYNTEDTIERTINSVIGQQSVDLEYIIIDGKSQDGTVNIIKKYEKDIFYWSSEKDNGIYDAMNKGLSKATGDIVSFLNGDDWYEDDILSYIDACFEKQNIDVLVGKVNRWIGDKKIIDRSVEVPIDNLKYTMTVNHQTVFMKKEFLNQIGNFSMNYKLAADYELMIRAYYRKGRFAQVDKYFVNFSNDGISKLQFYRYKKEAMEIALTYAGGNQDVVDEINDRCNSSGWYYQTVLNWIAKYEWKWAKQKIEVQGKKVYIWGAGYGGMECCAFMQTIHVEVAGFIDSFKKEKKLQGIPIYRPQEINEDAIVYISVKNEKTYREIEKQILALGFSEGGYYWFKEIRNGLFEEKKDKYDRYIEK